MQLLPGTLSKVFVPGMPRPPGSGQDHFFTLSILDASRRLKHYVPDQQQAQLAEGISRLSNSTAQSIELFERTMRNPKPPQPRSPMF
jgi:hypothetical protein